MRILTIGEFDPAGVHLRHRRWLRKLGVDYRLAVRDLHRAEAESDYRWGPDRDHGPMYEFMRQADIVQVLPAIGQPWSTTYDNGPRNEFGDIDHPRVVALFHGSAHAQRHCESDAATYRARGWSVAATTLDYVHRLGCEWLPPIVDCDGVAPLRADNEPLMVVHAPTDIRQCQSSDAATVCISAGVRFTRIKDKPHAEVLATKLRHNAGYDHIRGAFSVNSLENARMGLVNLVGVRPEYVPDGLELPWPVVQTMDDVAYWVARLKDDAATTREFQMAAREWSATVWSPEQIAERLLATYRRFLS